MIERRSLTAALLASIALAACGGGGVPAALATASPTPAPTASPTPSPSAAPAAAGSLTFTVGSGSKAVVRVTEQLADRQDLSDAVLTTDKVTGEFTLQPDGTFAASSKITADLTALSSDRRQRDDFIKRSTLETRQFPSAVFVPTKADGLTLPLAASGDLAFTLTGQLTVRGATKTVVFDVKAKRSGGELLATATIVPAIKFADFGMTQPRVFTVVSIKDEIRLEVQLVAAQRP